MTKEELLSVRESTEWVNYWYDRAKYGEADRILMIGDSTARMVRSTFGRIYGHPVDFFGTSAGFQNPMFWKQIDAFWDSCYDYVAVYVQIGVHARFSGVCSGESGGGKLREADYEDYRQGLIRLCGILKEHTERIILLTIFDSVKLKDNTGEGGFLKRIKDKCVVAIHSKRSEEFDMEACAVTRRRSEIIKQVADDQGYDCCDIRTWLNESPYRHIDHIHYENRSKAAIVREYIKYL